MGRERFTQKQVIEAVRLKDGLVTHVAQALGCCLQTVLNYREKYPAIDQAIKDAREGMVDLSESTLNAAMRSRDEAGNVPGPAVTAAIFVAKCLGKNRGYIERSEIEHKPVQEFTGDRPIETLQEKIDRAKTLVAALSERKQLNGQNGSNGNGHA